MFGRPSSLDDERLVQATMQELQQASSGGQLPDPSFIWWKAQFLRRLDAEREATAPIEIGERVHIGAAVLGAAALTFGAWDQLSQIGLDPGGGLGMAVIIAAGAIGLLSVVAIAALDVVRQR
jgi:hypothetical protein